MAKDKLPKTKGVPNKHLHARTTFLYQAATYLTLQSGLASKPVSKGITQEDQRLNQQCSDLALQLSSDLQTVSRKGQIKLSMGIKRTICKSCNSILIPGRTATHEIENDSKDSKKPWADVLVVTCTLCGSKKRFPVGATRQEKKAKRALRVPSQDSDGARQTTSATQTVDQTSASGG